MIYLRRLSNLVEKIPKKIRYTLIVIDIIILVVLIFDVYGPKYELIAESGYENRYIEIYQNMNDYKEIKFVYGNRKSKDVNVCKVDKDDIKNKLDKKIVEFDWEKAIENDYVDSGFSGGEELYVLEISYNTEGIILDKFLIE